MALPLETVVKQLTDSGILAPGKLEEFVPPKAHPTSVDALVAELVKHSQLTPFQAAQVKAGKVRALILGAYTLIDRIGAGGMGQVFKAQHRKMERIVAIKMLPKAMLEDAAAAARFQREVVAASKLLHPNIVSAFDAAEASGVHFLVMEYVEGLDLSALVKKDGPLPVGKAVNYILQAARGLEFAHSKGVIHRDIKPANLLLGKDGTVKILDMGLARIEGEAADHQLTSSGTIMGTVDFMAPEQAISTRNADARADIYSLGISLYYLLSAKPAYDGETAIEKLMAHQTQPIPSLQDVQTTVPKGLDAVFRKMVAKKMEDRYQSMSEVIEALEELGIGAATTRKREVASTLALSPEQKKKLAATAKKKPLGSLTEKVASEKTKHLVAKIIGGAFATIVAPILVTYFIRYLEKKDEPSKPPAAVAEATVPVVEASNTTSQPAVPVASGGGQTPLAVPSTAVASSVPAIGTAPPLAKAPFDAAGAKAHQAAWAKYLGIQVETLNSVGMRMTLIPPGEFLMGSTPEQMAWGRQSGEDDKISQVDGYWHYLLDEMPQHKVTISRPYLMGTTEVTVAQFRTFVEASKYITDAEKGSNSSNKAKEADKGKDWKNPGYAITDDTAATQITWNDALAYCTWLSEQEQRRAFYHSDGKGRWLIATQADGYRLPTEAEWEYACRAGTTTPFFFGDDKTQLEQYAWYKKNALGKAQTVALKRPNPFGLFDILGNAQEWCQDPYDGKWYETGPPNDPTGPSTSPLRATRGGNWLQSASYCRSAARYSVAALPQVWGNFGFRIVRPLAATQPETVVATTATPSASRTKPTKPWNTPTFREWVNATQALPAEKQIEAVSKKLIELNPGFDGVVTDNERKGTPKIENGVVTELGFVTENVTDISPVRALEGLKALKCVGSNPDEKGKLVDLSPLEGMRLTTLSCFYTQVSDLAPLRGTKLSHLFCGGTQISDLSPLAGMPLKTLYFESTPVSDLSPLQGMELTDIRFTPKNITTGLDAIRPMKSLKTIQVKAREPITPAEFWKKYDAGEFGKPAAPAKLAYLDPAFQRWVAATQKLSAQQQLDAVSKKLVELNPGFDGKLTGWEGKGTPTIEKGVVTEVGFSTDNTTDISPVRALVGLTRLYCPGTAPGKSKLFELTPLHGMKLTYLSCPNTKVSDLSPLEGMPLTYLGFSGTAVSDLAPLKGLPLTVLWCNQTLVTDLTIIRGMPLTQLHCFHTKVSDLSPLGGMSLTEVGISPEKIATGLDLIRQMNSLTYIRIGDFQKLPAAEFWKKYDAGEFGKPAATAKLAYLDPAFQQWVKATQALPAEKQIEAVSKKLMELNPGFDGKLESVGRGGNPRIEAGMVTGLWLNTDEVTDLSPLRALAGLKRLICGRTQHSKLANLSPLRGLSLEQFTCGHNDVSDLSPLEGMPLTELSLGGTKVTDLSPIRGMPLTNLNFQVSPVADLSPVRGMRLSSLNCGGSNVSDLSPIAGMPLVTLIIDPQKITQGMDDLRRMTSLQTIGFDGNNKWAPAEFWKKYDAGEFGKPAAKKLAYLDPAFQKWVTDTQKLPAEKQIEAVSKKLMALNPGFDGKLTGYGFKGTPQIEKGVVTEFGFLTDNVTDISPVRALAGLNSLRCAGSAQPRGKAGQLSDLSPLRGMPLTRLAIEYTLVSDLSPLTGMKLTTLSSAGVPAFDLSSLHGMPLSGLYIQASDVSDLSPLKGMPLTTLICFDTKLSDLSPLQESKDLKVLDVRFTKVTPTAITNLQKALPSCKIDWDDPSKTATTQPTQPWNTPAFQAWVKATQALPAEQQIEAVSKKLMELNPGFDGRLTGADGNAPPKIENGVVTELTFFKDILTDISPVRALAGLKVLSCGTTSGKGKLSDLSPLEGMKLASLTCHNTEVSDLSPLRAAPLTILGFAGTQVSDLSPLTGMKLTTLMCEVTPVSDLSPLRGMPLARLTCGGTQISDLAPLKGMPLGFLLCVRTKVSDLSPLADCKSLTTLDVKMTNVTPAGVAALQQALPNCKIKWDDPSKPKTAEPAAAGKK